MPLTPGTSHAARVLNALPLPRACRQRTRSGDVGRHEEAGIRFMHATPLFDLDVLTQIVGGNVRRVDRAFVIRRHAGRRCPAVHQRAEALQRVPEMSQKGRKATPRGRPWIETRPQWLLLPPPVVVVNDRVRLVDRAAIELEHDPPVSGRMAVPVVVNL